MMDYSNSTQFDVFDIYRKFCDIRSGNTYSFTEAGNMLDDDIVKANKIREATNNLSIIVDSSMKKSSLILDELYKLSSRLNTRGSFSEYSNFYDFVFFMCRESGQKNITVSKAIAAWKMVLSGRFRLLDQWCEFVEKNQRYNISEDTWRQVLAFSRCVHEDLEGYDPEGAWPTLIDDFVEHMYRITGSNNRRTGHHLSCNYDDPEEKSSMFEEPLPGLKNLPGSKRKFRQDLVENETDSYFPMNFPLYVVEDRSPPPSEMNNTNIDWKRRKHLQLQQQVQQQLQQQLKQQQQQLQQQQQHKRCRENPTANASDEGLHTVTVSPLSSSEYLNTDEGRLSKGFSGLFSSSPVQNQEQRVPYTEVHTT